MPPKKGGKTAIGKGGGKETASGSPPPANRKAPPGFIIFAWLLAVVFLSSLLYFSKDYNPERVKPPEGDSGRTAQSAARPEPPPPGKSGSEHPNTVVKGATAYPPAQTGKKPAAKKESQEPFAVAMNKPSPPPVSPPLPDHRPKPVLKAAIVIDDFGPDVEMARKFIALPFAVTLSVLPFQGHSREIAELAHTQGRQVLLHCPMEPLGYPKINPGKGALLVAMSRDQIRRNLGHALDTSPYFAGVNNHEGSRMTQDPQAMKTFMALLKDQNLFFLDSMTTADSKAWASAREFKIPTRKRDIFLDHDPSPAAVRAQIARLIAIAKVQGTALAIGHPHEATLKALQEAGALFRKEGLEIVPAGELMSSR